MRGRASLKNQITTPHGKMKDQDKEKSQLHLEENHAVEQVESKSPKHLETKPIPKVSTPNPNGRGSFSKADDYVQNIMEKNQFELNSDEDSSGGESD